MAGSADQRGSDGSGLIDVTRPGSTDSRLSEPADQFESERQELKLLGTVAVWLSGISGIAYFGCSHTVRAYVTFIAKYFGRTLEILSK